MTICLFDFSAFEFAVFPCRQDHPGRTNQFHIATRDPLAILYNDRAVLEVRLMIRQDARDHALSLLFVLFVCS